MIRSRSVASTMLLTTSLVVGGCSSTTTTTPAVSPSPVASTTQAVLPPANPLEHDFQLDISSPVFSRGEADSWYPVITGPEAALYYDGKFYLFHDGAVQNPADLSHGFAYSEDGKAWTRPTPDDPILTLKTATDAGLDCPGNLAIGSVVVDDGTWVMYFTLTGKQYTWHGTVGRATATSPTGPWKLDPQPVFDVGKDGAWDARGVGFPSVVKTDSGWVMYYSTGVYVGRATSPDGVSWTRYDDPATDGLFAHGDPVLLDDGSGNSTSFAGDEPQVVQVGSGWMMTYQDRLGNLVYSTSVDGIHWTAGIVIVDATKMGVRVFLSSLMTHAGTAYLFFESGGGAQNGDTNIYLATWKM
jgi:hypothetical protein